MSPDCNKLGKQLALVGSFVWNKLCKEFDTTATIWVLYGYVRRVSLESFPATLSD